MIWHPNIETVNLYTIFKNPRDFPGQFVARRFEMGKPTQEHYVAPALEDVRDALPPGLTCLMRYAMDDPNIVEVWI